MLLSVCNRGCKSQFCQERRYHGHELEHEPLVQYRMACRFFQIKTAVKSDSYTKHGVGIKRRRLVGIIPFTDNRMHTRNHRLPDSREFRVGERGIVHRGRRGVTDGKAIDRAQARRGVDDGLNRFGHAEFIRGQRAGLKRKFQTPSPKSIKGGRQTLKSRNADCGSRSPWFPA